MSYVFDQSSLRAKLESISEWKRLSFGVFLLERSIPNYFLYQVESGNPGGSILRFALAKIWSEIEGTTDASATLSSDACIAVAPDTEEWSTLHTSAALDTSSIAANLLDYVESRDLGLLVDAASLMYDSMYVFLGQAETIPQERPEFDEKIKAHPLLQDELAFQDRDIEFLRDLDDQPGTGWPKILSRVIELQYFRPRLLRA